MLQTNIINGTCLLVLSYRSWYINDAAPAVSYLVLAIFFLILHTHSKTLQVSEYRVLECRRKGGAEETTRHKRLLNVKHGSVHAYPSFVTNLNGQPLEYCCKAEQSNFTCRKEDFYRSGEVDIILSSTPSRPRLADRSSRTTDDQLNSEQD